VADATKVRKMTGEPAITKDHAAVAERLLAKIEPASWWACWRWTGYVGPGGYGSINVERTPRPVHRISYELAYGPVPAGLQLDHLCRNRACANPLHLEAVTQQVNILRGIGGINTRSKTHCPHGHPYSGSNLMFTRDGRRRCRKCKNDDSLRRWRQAHGERRVPKDLPMDEIAEAYTAGRMLAELALDYGVATSTIHARLKAHGVELRAQGRPVQLPVDELAEKYLAGATTGELAEAYGVSVSTVNLRLRIHGVQIRKRGGLRRSRGGSPETQSSKGNAQ
jgi:hypothetical protein